MGTEEFARVGRFSRVVLVPAVLALVGTACGASALPSTTTKTVPPSTTIQRDVSDTATTSSNANAATTSTPETVTTLVPATTTAAPTTKPPAVTPTVPTTAVTYDKAAPSNPFPPDGHQFIIPEEPRLPYIDMYVDVPPGATHIRCDWGGSASRTSVVDNQTRMAICTSVTSTSWRAVAIYPDGDEVESPTWTFIITIMPDGGFVVDVTGVVTDADTGQPIGGATITVQTPDSLWSSPDDQTTSSPFDGGYGFAHRQLIELGMSATVTVEADGYDSSSKTVSLDGTMRVDFALTPLAGTTTTSATP